MPAKYGAPVYSNEPPTMPILPACPLCLSPSKLGMQVLTVFNIYVMSIVLLDRYKISLMLEQYCVKILRDKNMPSQRLEINKVRYKCIDKVFEVFDNEENEIKMIILTDKNLTLQGRF